MKTKRMVTDPNTISARARDASARARDAAARAVPLGKQAGTTAAQAGTTVAQAGTTVAQGVRQGAEGVKRGVHSARRWSAPRLHSAADTVDTTVAPRVSGALRATARQVDPGPAAKGKRGLSALLSWRGLLAMAGIMAAAGAAAAAAMQRRYRTATAEAAEDGEEQATAAREAGTADPADVNGRVPTSGR